MSIASMGNDHRLGANEAPPAVVTVFLGELLERVLDAIESGKVDLKTEKQVLNLGLSQVPEVIGVSGCSRMPESDSSWSPTNRWPRNTVRPFSGKAGQTTVKSAAVACIKASATGPMLPAGVESKVEQTLK